MRHTAGPHGPVKTERHDAHMTVLALPEPGTSPRQLPLDVVLDGGDLAQASVGVTALLRHLTRWSPSLLKYSSKETKVSTIDKLYDGENWLSPVVDDEQATGSVRGGT